MPTIGEQFRLTGHRPRDQADAAEDSRRDDDLAEVPVEPVAAAVTVVIAARVAGHGTAPMAGRQRAGGSIRRGGGAEAAR